MLTLGHEVVELVARGVDGEAVVAVRGGQAAERQVAVVRARHRAAQHLLRLQDRRLQP